MVRKRMQKEENAEEEEDAEEEDAGEEADDDEEDAEGGCGKGGGCGGGGGGSCGGRGCGGGECRLNPVVTLNLSKGNLSELPPYIQISCAQMSQREDSSMLICMK